eukprot:s4869_g1.t1
MHDLDFARAGFWCFVLSGTPKATSTHGHGNWHGATGFSTRHSRSAEDVQHVPLPWAMQPAVARQLMQRLSKSSWRLLRTELVQHDELELPFDADIVNDDKDDKDETWSRKSQEEIRTKATAAKAGEHEERLAQQALEEAERHLREFNLAAKQQENCSEMSDM